MFWNKSHGLFICCVLVISFLLLKQGSIVFSYYFYRPNFYLMQNFLLHFLSPVSQIFVFIHFSSVHASTVAIIILKTIPTKKVTWTLIFKYAPSASQQQDRKSKSRVYEWYPELNHLDICTSPVQGSKSDYCYKRLFKCSSHHRCNLSYSYLITVHYASSCW